MATIEEEVQTVVGTVLGIDSEGNEYKSLAELWRKVQPLSGPTAKPKEGWYEKANAYWEDVSNCPCTDDGVLGGYGSITPVDILGSKHFLEELQRTHNVKFGNVADCGAGIGRITKNLLLSMFQHVDLIEQSQRLLKGAPAYIGVPADSTQISFVLQGLQSFMPAIGSYDVIWIQWVIGHLEDTDFIKFIQRCVSGLAPGGVVVIKDNVIEGADQTFYLDLSDNSVCRHLSYLYALLELSGVQVILEQIQQGFPEELYPVHMLALRAKV